MSTMQRTAAEYNILILARSGKKHLIFHNLSQSFEERMMDLSWLYRKVYRN